MFMFKFLTCRIVTFHKKVFSQLKSRVLLVKLHMMDPCVPDWAQGKEPMVTPVKIVVTLEQNVPNRFH